MVEKDFIQPMKESCMDLISDNSSATHIHYQSAKRKEGAKHVTDGSLDWNVGDKPNDDVLMPANQLDKVKSSLMVPDSPRSVCKEGISNSNLR